MIKKNDQVDFKRMRGSLAHLGAFDNFSETTYFLTTYELCKAFCAKNKKEYIAFTKQAVDSLHPDEVAYYQDQPKILHEEIYNRYNPFSPKREAFLRDMIFCKYVDYFWEYIKDVLSIITLSTAENSNLKRDFSIAEIITASHPLDLIEMMMESEIKKISQGNKKSLDTLLNSFGLNDVLTEKQKLQMEQYNNLRNEIMHARGIRNTYLKDKKKRKRYKTITKAQADRAQLDIWKFIDKIDKAANKKYELYVGNAWLIGRNYKSKRKLPTETLLKRP